MSPSGLTKTLQKDYIGKCDECGRGHKTTSQIRYCCYEIKISKFESQPKIKTDTSLSSSPTLFIPSSKLSTETIQKSAENQSAMEVATVTEIE